MSTVAIEARAVERRFPGGRGVGPLSLEVVRGETLALMGHNGAGKTTLLRLLCTADRPRGGELRWHGERSPAAARRSLGLALDGVEEEPCLTGRQAAHFWCRRWVADRDRASHLVDSALARFGLDAVADEPLGRYSFGMRRRLGLVEALAHEPVLAFLDEPTAGLDPQGVATLRDELRRRDGAGLASVVASNDCAFVEAASTRVAFLAAGLLHRCAPPAELLAGSERTRVAELSLAGVADPAAFARIPGVEAAVPVEAGLHVHLSTAGDALPAVVALADRGPGLRALRLRRADLGDSFAAICGRALEDRG